MNLIQAILECTSQGVTVSFKQEGQNLSLRLTKTNRNEGGVKINKIVENILPLRDDHLDEHHLTGCIEFLYNKLKK